MLLWISVLHVHSPARLVKSVEQCAGEERMKIEDLEKYSKRALIRAYLCAHSEGQSGCPAGGGEHCKMMKGCRKVTPADWWNDDVLPEYKDFTPVQLAERCRRGACPYKEGDIVSGWDRDGTSPAKVDKILFTPSYPYYDLRVLPITEGGKPSRRHRYAYNVLDVTPYEGDE